MSLAKIIAIVNQKGGVGKTTTAINVSSALGILKQKVLLIDTDPKANATSGLGILTKNINNSILNLYNGDKATRDCIIETCSPNLKIIPGSVGLSEIAVNLKNLNINSLRIALAEIKNEFDYIIIDCSPSLGYLTLNSLVASDAVIIPIQCEYFALNSLNNLMSSIESVKTSFNSKLSIEGILVTMCDKKGRHNKKILDDLEVGFRDQIFNTIIKRNISLSEAPRFGTSVHYYNTKSQGAIDYLNLSSEIINNKSCMKTKLISKKIPKIINNEKLVLPHKLKVRNLDAYKAYSTNDDNYDKLKGLNKKEVVYYIGLMYNDIHSDVWMYRITKKKNLFKKKYLYLYFNNNRVKQIETKRFKFG